MTPKREHEIAMLILDRTENKLRDMQEAANILALGKLGAELGYLAANVRDAQNKAMHALARAQGDRS